MQKVELQLEQDAISQAKNKLEHEAALRAAALRAEQERALDLLQREKASALSLAASAEEKLRRAEAASKDMSRKEMEIRRRLEMAEEQVRSFHCRSCAPTHVPHNSNPPCSKHWVHTCMACGCILHTVDGLQLFDSARACVPLHVLRVCSWPSASTSCRRVRRPSSLLRSWPPSTAARRRRCGGVRRR